MPIPFEDDVKRDAWIYKQINSNVLTALCYRNYVTGD